MVKEIGNGILIQVIKYLIISFSLELTNKIKQTARSNSSELYFGKV